MATEQITLSATTGRTLGTRPSRRLRAEGKVPAVVYGLGTEPVSISVVWSELRAALVTDAGLNAVIDLDVEGDHKLTIVKEMQRHPVRRNVIHVDFVVIDPDVAVTVDVPIVLQGADEADHLAGLVIDQQMFTITVSAKPDVIPNEIVVDLAGLTADAPIRAGDLALPAGTALEVDPDETIVVANVPMTEAAAEGEAEETAGDAAAPEAAEESAADEAGDAAEAAEGDAEG